MPKFWELRDLKFDRTSFNSISKDHFLYDAANPELGALAGAQHRLILKQAMSDAKVLPAHAVLYHMALPKQMGTSVINEFVRFYEFARRLSLWPRRRSGDLESSYATNGKDGTSHISLIRGLRRPIRPSRKFSGTRDVNASTSGAMPRSTQTRKLHMDW